MSSSAIEREDPPKIPDGWDCIKNEQKGLHGYSYSHFRLDEVSSALQKAIRRGLVEAYQWALEMFYVNTPVRTNLWNRLLVMCLEDVGPADPLLIIKIWDLMKDRNNALSVVKAVYLLINAPKSRVNDWGYHVTVVEEKDKKSDCKVILETYIKALTEKNTIVCLYLTRLLWHLNEGNESKEKIKIEKQLLKEYDEPLKNNNPMYIHWIAYNKVIKGNQYLLKLREIALSTNWRWRGNSNLIYCQIIHLWCYGRLPRNAEYGPIKFPEDLGDIVSKHLTREVIVGMPDHALDKHTHRGSTMGRGLQHFIEVGGILNNVDSVWKPLDDFYLNAIKERGT